MQYSFNGIVDIKKWQTIQDHFSEVLRITLRTVDKKGTFLTATSFPAKLCNDLTLNSIKAVISCKGCLGRVIESTKKDWKEGCICPSGFYNFAVPLEIMGETVAYFVVGPVILAKYRETELYKETAKVLGINAEKFLDALREIKVSSFYGMRSVIELLHDIGLYVCQLSYQDAELKNLLPQTPFILKRVHHFYLEKLLNALLEVSCNFTEAERGSIMLLDRLSKQLYIKMAKGLEQEIIDKTKIKIGDGLAGIVAKEEKPLFIDKNVIDKKILKRLRNPGLKYSMLIPIKVKEKLLGVLNVSTSKADSDKFTSQGIETINKLTELVGTALENLPQPPA